MSQKFTLCQSPACGSTDAQTYDAYEARDGKVVVICRHRSINQPLGLLAFENLRLETQLRDIGALHQKKLEELDSAHAEIITVLEDKIAALTSENSAHSARLLQVDSMLERQRAEAEKAKADAVRDKESEVRLEMSDAHNADLKAKNGEIDRLNAQVAQLHDGWNGANARAKACGEELHQLNESMAREREANAAAVADLQMQVVEKDERLRQALASEKEAREEAAKARRERDNARDEEEMAKDELKNTAGELNLLKNVLRTMESPISAHEVLRLRWFEDNYELPDHVNQQILAGLDPLATEDSNEEEPAPDETPTEAAPADEAGVTTHEVVESQIIAAQAQEPHTEDPNDHGGDAEDDGDFDASSLDDSVSFEDESTDPGAYDAQASYDDGSAADEDDGPAPCEAPTCMEHASHVAHLVGTDGKAADVYACDTHAEDPEPIAQLMREMVSGHRKISADVLREAFKNGKLIPALSAPSTPNPDQMETAHA